MGAALVLLLVALAAMSAGVLIGRYYVPDDRQLRRTARHSRSYMRALSHLIARDHDTVVSELRTVVEENVDDVEPYFALGAMFRSKGEHERAIRVHQALAVRERDKRKLRQRAMYELGLDFRAAGMPRRATRAMEEVLLEEPAHEGALRALAALYEEQARFNEAANLWQRLGRRRNEDTSEREHHLLVAAAQAALGRDDLESAKNLLKAAQKQQESAHFFSAAAELAAARSNHRGAKERLRQALIADPALAPHLLPGLIAAEQGLTEDSGTVADDLVDPPAADAPQLTAGAGEASTSNTPIGETTALATTGSALATTALATPGAALATTATPGTATDLDQRTVPVDGISLVPAVRPRASVAERVIEVLAEVEAATGPRLELALIRAQLIPPADAAAQLALAKDLATRFPEALAARVATARLTLVSTEPAELRHALEVLVADQGVLAWTLRGRWQCGHCGNRPGPFSWRCGQCRRWASMRMETGIEPPPAPSRERRAAARVSRPDGLLGAGPEDALPPPTLDPGLSEDELAVAGTRRSVLGRVGGWVTSTWRRGADR